MTNNDILKRLSAPFHPSKITWKPQAVTKQKEKDTPIKALAVAYADLRAYQDRLDDVCGLDWSVSYTPWGDRIICHVTVNGITRSSTGEASSDSERSEIAGTAAEAQAFKRACAMFGLGRYLYNLPTLWVEYEAEHKRFTDKALSRLNGLIAQHYQRYLDGQGEEPTAVAIEAAAVLATGNDSAAQLDALGRELYGEQWPTVRQHNVKRLTGKDNPTLTADQVQKLVGGLQTLKAQRVQAA